MSERDRPKRPRLPGSEELFRNTRAEGRAGPGSTPVEPVTDALAVELTPEEIAAIVEALQLARFPERHRVRPTMTEFERLGFLQDRLRRLIAEDE